MLPKRTKSRVLKEILEVCTGNGANKTRIVYQANLNLISINPYLDLLTKNGLLKIIEGKITRYKITAKGERALKSLRKIDALIPGV